MGYIITKFCLKKPVTAFLIMLSVVFFGFVSISSFKYELMPEITMPMYGIITQYPGAQPEDIDELVTKKLEEEVFNLQGVKNLQGSSRENLSIVGIQYDYGQNMDKAYIELKKAVDSVKGKFDSSVKEPTIIEADMNSMPSMKLAVRNKVTKDIYNYVSDVMVKDIEKILEVSEVNISGGQENYIKILLKPEMLERYNLSMTTLKSIIANADFTFPGGEVNVGDRKLAFSSSVRYKTIDSLKTIPIITGNNRTLYLEDIADIFEAKEDKTAIGRYNNEDCIIVSITKTQSGSTIALSDNVKKVVDKLKDDDKNLEVTIIEDSADNIGSSIKNVFESMIIAIILSMLIIFLFLGDIKASLIVGTSIPFSLLTAFVAMYLCGYTLNVVTLSALVLGVGMMVDNSIVVLEACFRASDEYKGQHELSYYCKAALNAARTIGASVIGSTLTTVVVFAPLGFLSGLSGQFFKPLGFTIVFCMIASYFSSISVVPLLYVLYKPIEKTTSPTAHAMEHIQYVYSQIIPKFLKHKWLVTIVSILILIGSFALLIMFKVELVAKTDNGMIKLSIQTKPGLSIDARDKIYKDFEKFVSEQHEVENFVLSNSASSMGGGGGQALIAYLVEEDMRDETTDEIISRWKKALANVTDCTIDISSYSSSSMSSFAMLSSDKMEFILQSTDYQRLKQTNDRIVKMLEQRNDVSNISTTLDNAAPIVKANIDPILAAAEGFTPATLGGTLNNLLSGVEVMDKTIDGNIYKIKLKYSDEEYDTIEKVANIKFKGSSGKETMLKDISTIGYFDNPSSIPKYNKKYRTTITLFLNENATEKTRNEITKNIIEPMYSKYIEKASNLVDEMRGEEFGALIIAVLVAAFLVFVVMASQFESVRFSLMVMGTVLFSFSGGIFALWVANLKLSIVVFLGLLMLIGTAVNNGILYVDTVNQFLDDGNELTWSLVEAGRIRLRPIFMTTLTTIVSMIPMSLAYGKNGETLQGLAVVDIGGLISSTIMALFLLPVYYYIFGTRKKGILEKLRPVATDASVDVEEKLREKAIENAARRKNEKK